MIRPERSLGRQRSARALLSKPTAAAARPGLCLCLCLCLCLALLSLAPLFLHAARAGEPAAPAQLPPLQVKIDLAEVDLAKGELTLRMSRPAARVTLEALSLSGAVLAEAEQHFEAVPAGSPLVVHWSPPEQAVARIEVYGYDVNGYFKAVAITPWSFEIPHQDVVFETDSADIRPSEAGKLQASLLSIQKQLARAQHLGTVTLFIVAHTDTVATAEYNQELSTRRAQALARWFRSHALKLPIAYSGMGERALKVKTADQVDEPRNRRADYMLGLEPPRFKTSGATPSWTKI
jgi:outer membrane protein OmpA-like peptidoglycan-associated protein